MEIRNPIDRRHANPTGTRCPVFWRNFGTKFAWILPMVPWGVFACMHVIFYLLALCASVFEVNAHTRNILDSMPEIMWVVFIVEGALLLPVSIAWCVVMRTAVNRGLADKDIWKVCCMMVGFWTIYPLLAGLGLLILLLALLELGSGTSLLALAALALFGLLIGLVSVRWIRSRSRRQHAESSHDHP